MNQREHKSPVIVFFAAVVVILIVAGVLCLPLLIPAAGSGGGIAATQEDLNTANNPTSTKPSSLVADAQGDVKTTNNGNAKTAANTQGSPLESEGSDPVLALLAPLMNPGEKTTSFESMTPPVRKQWLKEKAENGIAMFQRGLKALNEMESAGGAVEERTATLARMTGFVKDVNAGPAKSLWATLSSGPAIDRRLVDDDRRLFQGVIDRLQQAIKEGFREKVDSRLDVNKELPDLQKLMALVPINLKNLRDSQRNLDRVEFVVWTHASELPAKQTEPTKLSTQEQVASNFDWGEQLAIAQTVRQKLDATRSETMAFLRSLPKINEQVQSFLAEPSYADDPVGKWWVGVGLTSASFIEDFHAQEAAVDRATFEIMTDSGFTASDLEPVLVKADTWEKGVSTRSQERRFALAAIQKSITAAPFLMTGNKGAFLVKREDGREATDDEKQVQRVAAWRKMISRHSYAVTFDRPANRYNWAVGDLLEPYVSYDCWWNWATNADWYRGSDVRLDPDKFPKNAPETKKLWKEFRYLVDGDERLTPLGVKTLLGNPGVQEYPTDWRGDHPRGANDPEDYLRSLFLTGTRAKGVGYRRPPPRDAATAELIDAMSSTGSQKSENFPWNPPPVLMPRLWELPKNPGEP